MTTQSPPHQPIRKSTKAPEKQKKLNVRAWLETPEERDLKEQRKQEILSLLEHLANSQETTVRMILERLYDMGAINLANNRIAFRPLNRTVKSMAKLPKPLVMIGGLCWFKKHCPELIAHWLTSQVEFKPLELAEKIEEGLSEVEVTPNANLEARDREVKELRSQIRLLAGGLVLAIALLGGTTAWLGYQLQFAQTPVRETTPEARLYNSP
jgi:predicted transcriptional regulator